MSPLRLLLGIVVCAVIGYAYGPLAHAQVTLPLPPVAGCTIDVAIPFTITAADGTSTVTTVTIPCNALFNFFYQATQHERNSNTLQNMKQYANPVCLVDPQFTNNSTLFENTTNKLRDFDGALYGIGVVNSVPGVPFRNGQRMGTTTTVQKICLYGDDVIVKGRNDNKWYVWQRASSTWFLPSANSLDPTVFN